MINFFHKFNVKLTFRVKYLGQTEHFRRAFSHSHLALVQGFDDCAARAPNTIAALLPSFGSELLILFPENTVPRNYPSYDIWNIENIYLKGFN